VIQATSTIAALLYGTSLCLLALLHWKRPELSVVRNAVSEYGTGSTATLFRLNATIGSIAALLLAVGFYLSPDIARSTSIALFLVLMIVARTGVSIWPTDAEGHPVTASGRIHLLFAIVSFTFTYMAVTRIADVLPAVDHWPGFQTSWSPFRWLVSASLAATVATMLRPLRAWFGLAERAFLILTPLFFLTAALWMATR